MLNFCRKSHVAISTRARVNTFKFRLDSDEPKFSIKWLELEHEKFLKLGVLFHQLVEKLCCFCYIQNGFWLLFVWFWEFRIMICVYHFFCIKFSLFSSFWNIVKFENLFELTSTQYMYQIVTPQNRSFMLHIKHLRRKNVQILDSNFCSRLLFLEFIRHLLHKRTVSFSFSFWKNLAEYVFCLLFYVHL